MQEEILYNLVEKPSYFRTVYPYLKQEYFNKLESGAIFKHIQKYVSQYESIPTKKELVLSIKSDPAITADSMPTILHKFKEIYTQVDEFQNEEYLNNKTLEYIQYQEFTTNVLKGAEVIQKKGDFTPVWDAIGNALKISFDEDLGTNFLEIEDSLEYYKRDLEGTSTGVASIDLRLGGGFYPKTLNVVAAVTHGGKSLLLSSVASHILISSSKKKHNIVFFTLEMSEKETLKRIYANTLDIDINTFRSTEDAVFMEKLNEIKDSIGTLWMKEYAPGTLTVHKIEAYLDKLEAQTGIKPDIIMVDYMGIMDSIAVSPNVGSYTYYKRIAEELRGLAMKLDLPIVTAAQLNRSGFEKGKESGLDSVSDSLGIAQTADTFSIISRTTELDELGQVAISYKKNRNTGMLDDFLVGIDFPKMRFYDLGGDPSIMGNVPTHHRNDSKHNDNNLGNQNMFNLSSGVNNDPNISNQEVMFDFN